MTFYKVRRKNDGKYARRHLHDIGIVSWGGGKSYRSLKAAIKFFNDLGYCQGRSAYYDYTNLELLRFNYDYTVEVIFDGSWMFPSGSICITGISLIVK